jgi:pimeloyl-ACP methyl ester carboxylesterase
VVAAILGAVLPVMGCADNAEYLTEDRLNNGLVIILPGIEGHSQLNENIRRGLVAGGVYRAIPIHPWGRPVPLVGPLITQVDFLGNRLAGIGMAKIVTDYQDKYPDRPVYIVGHSGGGGVAVFTAEAMPEGRQIDGLILLSASISSAYDLKKALSHCRNGIVSFYNKGDSTLLGLGTIVIGTVDGTHGPSAGLIGFDAFDKPGYESLYQVKMVGVSEDSHTTSTQMGFVANFVTPWVLSDSWPVGSTDAYVDETGPLPNPPAAGAQLARAANGKPAPGKPAPGKPAPAKAAPAAPAKTAPATPAKTAPATPGKTPATPGKTAPATPGKSPAAPAGTQPGGHVDESLLAAARAKSLAAKQKASPVHTHTTAGPRLPTDETIDPDDSAKPRDPNRPSRDEAPAATPADMLPPPADPEDEADPAAIAPIGGLRPAPLGGQRQAEESTSRPKTAPRFRRW